MQEDVYPIFCRLHSHKKNVEQVWVASKFLHEKVGFLDERAMPFTATWLHRSGPQEAVKRLKCDEDLVRQIESDKEAIARLKGHKVQRQRKEC